MKRNLVYWLIFVVAVVGACRCLLYLVLDLQEGVYLMLQVRTQEGIEAEVNKVRERIEAALQEKNIPFFQTRVTEDLIEIESVPRDRRTATEEYLSEYSESWSYQSQLGAGGIDFVLEMSRAGSRALKDSIVRQAMETIQRRLDQYRVRQTRLMGENQIGIDLRGVEDLDRVIELITRTGSLDLQLVHPSQGGPYPTREMALQAFNNGLPSDYEILPYRAPTETGEQTLYMVVRKAPSITDQHLKDARRSQDSFTGRAEIEFFLKAEGVKLLSQTTGENIGTRLAIVLDNQIVSAPNIMERISSESARVTGNFTPEEAADLALVLRSGRLRATISISERQTVGPFLGLDSIKIGMAALIGLALGALAMLIRQSVMKCPNCGSDNRSGVLNCTCGYNFQNKQLETTESLKERFLTGFERPIVTGWGCWARSLDILTLYTMPVAFLSVVVIWRLGVDNALPLVVSFAVFGVALTQVVLSEHYTRSVQNNAYAWTLRRMVPWGIALGLTMTLTILGSFLLIVPGMILGVRLFWADEFALVDRRGPVQSLRKSWELTRGRFGSIFAFQVLMSLASIPLILVLWAGIEPALDPSTYSALESLEGVYFLLYIFVLGLGFLSFLLTFTIYGAIHAPELMYFHGLNVASEEPYHIEATVPVLTAGNPVIIAAAKSILEDAEIEYCVKNESTVFWGALGGPFNPLRGPAYIQVPQEDEPEARKLLEHLDESPVENPMELVCSECGATVSADDRVCPSCGESFEDDLSA